jgi:hypothetical protein
MISQLFYKGFSNRYKALQQAGETEPLLSFSGDIGQGLSYALTTKLEQLLQANEVPKVPSKRIFNVFVEALQNVRKHGGKSPEGDHLAGIAVFKTKEGFQLYFSNLVKKKTVDRLSAKIDEVNSNELKELKRHYMEVMSDGEFSEEGGAGLGIITIRLKSKAPISFDAEHLKDDFYIAHISLHINV